MAGEVLEAGEVFDGVAERDVLVVCKAQAVAQSDAQQDQTQAKSDQVVLSDPWKHHLHEFVGL